MNLSIQLADINDELTRLWDKEQGEKKIRASLFNLILYVQNTEKVAYYENLIKSVVSKFPCRVILILCDESAGAEHLRTRVSSETIGKEELQIYCELIKIEVAGKLIERVPYIILPHILPDLPIYLLWAQDPATESAVLPHLEPFADRIIFDSESMSNLQNYSKAVISLISRFHCAIGDLHWSALSGWRSLLVQTFNSKESLLSLARSKMIRLYYAKGESCQNPHIEAAYLQAWIASRLNWKFKSIERYEGKMRLTYQCPFQEVLFLLIPREESQCRRGTLLEIEIESSENAAHYIFKKEPKTRQVFIQHSEKNLCHLPYFSYLTGKPEGEEIVEEIFYPSGGKHYSNMLDVLLTIPWRKP